MQILKSLFLVLLVTACKQHREPEAIDYQNQNEVYKSALLTREITLIDTLQQLNTNEIQKPKGPLKIVSQYVASCSPCLVKMKKWLKLSVEDSLFKDVEFIFYAKNELTWYFQHQVQVVNNFPFPIYHDPADVFPRTNNSPEMTYVKSVLLNQDNKVIYAGNPMDDANDFDQLVDAIKKFNANYEI